MENVKMMDGQGRWAEADTTVLGPDECLARLARGRRLLLDADAPGSWDILRADGPISSANGPLASLGQIEDFLEAWSDEPGEFAAVIRRGPPPPSGTAPGAAGKGVGWALCSGQVTRDGRREPEGPFPVPVWLPFYESVEGADASLAAPWRLERALRLAVGDDEALKAVGWRVRNASKPEELSSEFPDGSPHTALKSAHLNEAVFAVSVPEGAQGLRLRKVYDRFHGRQRARVLVDGAFAGWWHLPRQSRAARWAVADFFVAQPFVKGRASLEITLDPPASVPLWDWSELMVDAILPLG
jgi:hypothetical protein